MTRLHLKRGKIPKTVARFMPKIRESYILERSTVDPVRRTLTSEMRNLDWDGVLSVVENQEFVPAGEHATAVRAVVRFESKLGTARRHAAEEAAGASGERAAGRGWLGAWGASGVQRSIELVGRSRMRDGLARSREGMNIVLERLKERGFLGVVSEQRQGRWQRWRGVWREGFERRDEA